MAMDKRQYDSAAYFMRDQDDWERLKRNVTNADDLLRLKSYEFWEDMYHNRPEHQNVVLRGEDDDSVEIYLPSAKKCIEAVNRFTAVDFDWTTDPDSEAMDDVQSSAEKAMENLFKRQDVRIKFANVKRYMLIKGDALLHVRGIGWERAGRRVHIDEIKPENYFPIESNVTGTIVGCHVVDVIKNPKNSTQTRGTSDAWLVRRQTYRFLLDDNGIPTPQAKDETNDGGGIVTSQLTLHKVGKWDDRTDPEDCDTLEELEPEKLLDPRIDQLPVYHWRNNAPPNSTFGLSELAGFESIILAINQAASDEDLTLITQGLGVYWTDGSPPTDDNGDETEWEIGPGAVVQVTAGSKFDRVQGVSSVAPYHEHIKMLDEAMQQGMGVPDIAIGAVDVTTAESGIALQLKFGPLLAKCKEKDMLIADTTDAFLEDLLKWLVVYEGAEVDGVVIQSLFGDPMPRNKSEELTEVLEIWTQAAGVLPVEWLYDQLNDIMGYDLDYQTDFDKAIEDAKKIAKSSMPADPFGAQMGDEFPNSGVDGQMPPPGDAPLNGKGSPAFAFS